MGIIESELDKVMKGGESMTDILNRMANEQEQISFASAVYHDEEMSVQDKLKNLALCAQLPDGEARREAETYFNQLCRVCEKHDCLGDYTHFE